MKPPWKLLGLGVFTAATILFVGLNYEELRFQKCKNIQLDATIVKKYERQDKERLRGEMNMQQIGDIKRQNSHLLPEPLFNPKEISTKCASASKEDTTCIPGFIQLESKYVIAPAYKLATCVIQKSMSTVMAAIMCYLFNEKKFTEAGRQFVRECHDVRFCAYKNEYATISRIREKFHLGPDDWRLILISRDPVDRFLSGFVDKCIRKPKAAGFCNGCGRNMTCFLITEYQRIKRQIQENRYPRTFDDRHFFPQTWRCNLNKEHARYNVIRYSADASGALLDNLIPQLLLQNVPESSIKFIKDQLMAGRTVHSTVDSEAREFLEKRLRSSPFLMEYVVRIFWSDFQFFNYSLPPGFL